jgi:hypothetical protein
MFDGDTLRSASRAELEAGHEGTGVVTRAFFDKWLPVSVSQHSVRTRRGESSGLRCLPVALVFAFFIL